MSRETERREVGKDYSLKTKIYNENAMCKSLLAPGFKKKKKMQDVLGNFNLDWILQIVQNQGWLFLMLEYCGYFGGCYSEKINGETCNFK